jgi:PAS domain S-box-containing protein
LREIARLKSQLETKQKILNSIRKREADAPQSPGNDVAQEPYRTFVETMNEGATIVAADGTIAHSNRRFAEMVKAPLEGVLGSSVHQFITQPEWPAMDKLQENEEASGYRWECSLRATDGELVPVHLSVRRMKTGGSQSFCVIATDITERKLAEEKLIAGETRLRLIFEQIPAVVWTTDTGLRIVSATGVGLAAGNRPLKSLIGLPLQEFLGDPDGESEPVAAHRAALKGESRLYEHNFNGTIFSVNVQPFHNADGRIAGVIGIALDVTENKRALAPVAKLAAIVEASQDAIIGVTPSGYITSWNCGAEQMYGYSAAEVIGQHSSIIVPEDRKQELVEVFNRLKQGETTKPFETVRRRKDGSLIDVSIAISAVRDSNGFIIGFSKIAHDLSDRKQVEMELRKLSARLLKVQDEARRNMARELHDSVIQGLAAAVINLSLLMDTTQLSPEARKTLEETLKITEGAVREIRTFSYLLHPPLLDAMGLQSALRWYVEGYSKRSGVQVELDLPEGRERIAREAELTLFRIVQEALTNIHRHSAGHQANICMRRAGGKLTLSVSDDGHGIDAETLGKIRREGAVLGVGIAGMKQRLQQLGGWLNISSSDKGTTVTASLPIEDEV